MSHESKALLRASKRYARENRWLSWWHLGSALVLFAALIVAACLHALPWPVRVLASVIVGMMIVRLFIVYHDYQHGTILKGSPLAAGLMTAYGLVTLNPPSIWNRSHNYHHKNNAKMYGTAIGSYPMMTVASYWAATPRERFIYRVSRHAITIALGYVTIFLYGMCIRSLVINPRLHFDSALAIFVHAAVIAVALIFGDWSVVVLAVLLPSTIAASTGAYFFYAQHNCPGLKLRDRAEWDYTWAALQSSSFIRMGRIMHWFTGNIGYHHVHHLNAHIPFYRLPEAMAGIPALQSPVMTSLSLRDIWRCLHLKLWDPTRDRLVTFE